MSIRTSIDISPRIREQVAPTGSQVVTSKYMEIIQKQYGTDLHSLALKREANQQTYSTDDGQNFSAPPARCARVSKQKFRVSPT